MYSMKQSIMSCSLFHVFAYYNLKHKTEVEIWYSRIRVWVDSTLIKLNKWGLLWGYLHNIMIIERLLPVVVMTDSQLFFLG